MKIFPRSRPRSRARSRRVFGRRDFHLADISAKIAAEISARFWPPRFLSRRDLGRDLGAFLAAEIFISMRSRPKTRRD